jgi:alginate O-acetyltransferase complex protein AlgI
MVFNSLSFAVYLPIVFTLYWIAFNRNAKFQNIILLFASIFFYAVADYKFPILLAISGLVNYRIAKFINRTRPNKYRNLFFFFGVVFNIAILLYFKYLNFFIDGCTSALNAFGFKVQSSHLTILLPIGLSFYTFQLIGYLVDVRNESIEFCDDILVFFTYLMYFPKILAGPIERIQNFILQIKIQRYFNGELAAEGIWQFLWGLMKKLLIADNSISLLNMVFDNPHNYPGSLLFFCAILNIVSIYADFSGYSDMACGISKLFNIRITNNFSYPFFSTDISSFWKKWHISLTSWMMDYVFTPLSFINRNLKVIGLFISIAITFILVGLWHGANTNYLIFGTLQAFYFIPIIIIRRKPITFKHYIMKRLWYSFKLISLFVLVALTSIFLKSENTGNALQYLTGILSKDFFTIPKMVGSQNTDLLIICILVALMLITEWKHKGKEFPLINTAKFPYYIQMSILTICIILLFIFGSNQHSFIYFQF